MAASGTYAYAPSLSEVSLEAMDRCGIRAAEITVDHWVSMKRTLNLVFTSWSNRGVNLWLIDTQTINLAQGVPTYSIPTNTVEIEEAYLRTYQMGQPVDVTPSFSTAISDATVTAFQANHGYVADGFINIEIPVSVGGLILLGFYEITSVPSNDTYTFEAASNATATISNGGTVPLYETTAQSATVTVTLAANGYLAGQPYVVATSVSVGGITLLGTYTIATVIDANRFTFTATQTAGAVGSVYENDGDTQIAGQQTISGTNAPYNDITLVPFSRVDYSNVPNKLSQGRPSQFYYDRQISPTVTLWYVPDNNGPYQMIYNRVTQPQDCDPRGTQTPYLPYRGLEAFHADVAAHFAMKWADEKAPALAGYAEEKWAEFAATDAENKPTLHLVPQINLYYSGRY